MDKIRRGVLCAVWVFFCWGAAAQSPGVVPGSGAPSGKTDPVPAAAAGSSPSISLYELLRAAEGSGLRWRPGWPPDMPGLFNTSSPAASITIEREDGVKLEFSRSGGRIRAFPFFDNGVFFQGKAEYDKEGRLAKLVWALPPEGKDAAKQEDRDAEVLERDAEGRPALFRVFDGDYRFAALEYTGAAVIESWYDRDGAALFVLVNGRSGTILMIPEKPGSPAASGDEKNKEENKTVETRFFYTNEGYLSAVEDASGTVEALYNQNGMPRLIGRTAAGSSETYICQWDEAGRLVRLSGGPEPPVDYCYEYTLDSRGNWIERRAFSMTPVGPPQDPGRLVPRELRILRRTIRYEDEDGR